MTTRAVKTTAAIAVVAIAGVAAGAWYVRRAQIEQLVTAAEIVDEVIDQWDTDRAAILDELPSAHYRTVEMEQDAAEQLRRTTVATLASLDDAVARVRGVRVTGPWNAAVENARDSYLHHVRRWAGYLTAITEDPLMALDDPPPPLTTTREATEKAFAAALPPLAGNDLRRRVDALLTR